MRTLLGFFETLRSLHRTMSTSDVPFVTRRHTRVGIPNIRPICCPIITRIPLRRIKRRGFYLRVRGPCFVLPVRARRAKARERLLSCCEPASRNPQAECRRFFKRSYTRAPIRLLSIRASASGGATDFFLASALLPQQALRPPGEKDARCVQPISATQTIYVHPHLVCSRLALATFAARMPHGVLGSVRRNRGSGRFTTSSWIASADRRAARNLMILALRWSHERGRFVPTTLTRSSL
jgi:hypothetical protein